MPTLGFQDLIAYQVAGIGELQVLLPHAAGHGKGAIEWRWYAIGTLPQFARGRDTELYVRACASVSQGFQYEVGPTPPDHRPAECPHRPSEPADPGLLLRMNPYRRPSPQERDFERREGILRFTGPLVFGNAGERVRDDSPCRCQSGPGITLGSQPALPEWHGHPPQCESSHPSWPVCSRRACWRSEG